MKQDGRTASIGDQQVGSRIRVRRRAMAMSQVALGEKIGVSFRQVQKYESGINRISITRLEQIAAALGAPVGEFLNMSAAQATSPKIETFSKLPEAHAFIDAYLSIEDVQIRKQIVRLTMTMATLARRKKTRAAK